MLREAFCRSVEKPSNITGLPALRLKSARVAGANNAPSLQSFACGSICRIHLRRQKISIDEIFFAGICRFIAHQDQLRDRPLDAGATAENPDQVFRKGANSFETAR